MANPNRPIHSAEHVLSQVYDASADAIRVIPATSTSTTTSSTTSTTTSTTAT